MSVLIKGMKMPKNEECAVLYIHEADGEGYVNCFTGERGKERTHCQYECIEIAEQDEPQTDCPYREYPCDVCDMQTDCAWK